MRATLREERFFEVLPSLETFALDLDEYAPLGDVEAFRAHLEAQAGAVVALRKGLLQAMRPRKMLVNLTGFPRVSPLAPAGAGSAPASA